MEIHLNQEEIHDALKNYVETRGFSLTNQTVEVTLTATRNPKGHSADISIQPSEPTEAQDESPAFA